MLRGGCLFRQSKAGQVEVVIIILSLNLLTTVVIPGEPPHRFSPHHRQRPDNSQTRTLGVRVSFPSHSNNSFPLFQSTMAVFTFTDPDMRRSPMAINATNINLSINTELLILSGDNQSV